MKRNTLLIVILLIAGFSKGHSQDMTQEEMESNCYLKYARVFEERGANDVGDGSHSDVIITFRNGSSADCLTGKVDVKDGKVVTMYLRMEDGSYEELKRKWKYEQKDVTIENGISRTLITATDELINVMFIKKIKPKKKGYEKAPDPSDL